MNGLKKLNIKNFNRLLLIIYSILTLSCGGPICTDLNGKCSEEFSTEYITDESFNCIDLASDNLINGGFESGPTIPDSVGWDLQDQSDISGWSSNLETEEIERWLSGGVLDIISYDGDYLVQLQNDNGLDGIYQDTFTVPGELIVWSLAHRGRSGTDTMRVYIGAPGYETAQAEDISTGTQWTKYSGNYTVPVGQTETRFKFYPLSSSTSDNTSGNLIDNISIFSGYCVN